MQKQLPPFNRGDEVMDDNAEIGYVLENHIDATWDAAGNLTNWHTRIHYRWDQPSYGLTRVVSEGEISLLTPLAPDAPPESCEHGNLRSKCPVEICSYSKHGGRR